MKRRGRGLTVTKHQEDTGRGWHKSMLVRAPVGVIVVAAIVFTGYTAAGQTAPWERERSAAADISGAPAGRATASGPSEAAKMICATQSQVAVATALALKTLPSTKSDFVNQTFVCTYDLDEGPLVITVKEVTDPASALLSLDNLQRRLESASPIDGLANLGLPGYRADTGVVLFAKDNVTLEVDATAMDMTLGPNRVSRLDFAYQLATNILACWKAHD